YDLTEIYEFSGKDETAMQTIIQAFVEGAQQSMEELSAAYEKNDEDKMGKLAHRMLPMLRQMKANAIIAILMKMESRDKVSPPEFDHFKAKINQLIAGLDQGITV
ncbi:MAG: Hpt domain-containing protein, partial [Gramella sp.]|nr:Hpt domain-containing protein [Christiangramia sp.]